MSSLGETRGYPFSFRYLEVKVEGTPLKMVMPVVPSPKFSLALFSSLPDKLC